MLPEDKKRLERERSIAKATAGSDYSRLEKAVRIVKAEHGKHVVSQRRSDAQENWAYQRLMHHHQITSDKHRRIQTQNKHKTYVPSITPEM